MCANWIENCCLTRSEPTNEPSKCANGNSYDGKYHKIFWRALVRFASLTSNSTAKLSLSGPVLSYMGLRPGASRGGSQRYTNVNNKFVQIVIFRRFVFSLALRAAVTQLQKRQLRRGTSRTRHRPSSAPYVSFSKPSRPDPSVGYTGTGGAESAVSKPIFPSK